jgi:hypothetical protein
MPDAVPPPGIGTEGWAATPLAVRVLVTELRQRLASFEARLNQTSQNSSKPPSSGPPHARPRRPEEPSGRKTGGNPGIRATIGNGSRRVKWTTSLVCGPGDAGSVARLMARVRTLLEEGAAGAGAKVQGTCRNLPKREAALWTSMWEPGVEPTHNSAERPLRRAVLWRRRGFGTPSEEGGQFVERILTAVTTLRQQRRDIPDYLTAACAAAIWKQPLPSLLPLTPPALFAT